MGWILTEAAEPRQEPDALPGLNLSIVVCSPRRGGRRSREDLLKKYATILGRTITDMEIDVNALGLPPVNVGILEVEVFTGTAFRTSSLVASIDLVVGQPAYGLPPFLFLIALFVEP